MQLPIIEKKISILIPVCNERGNLPLLIQEIKDALNPLPYKYNLLFIEDSSSDGTLEYIKELATNTNFIFYISLTKSFGHQNALKAGLDTVDSDAVIMMDGDLQHPPSLLPELIKEWENGNDIVYTIREDHKDTSLLKKKSSKLFYELINNLSDIELEPGTADFRLLDRKVVTTLKSFNESDLFLRGLLKWMGYKEIGIGYVSALRKEGHSKYSVKKMIRLALQGITSFSNKPLYLAAYLGMFFSLCSLLYIPYIGYALIFGHNISGWASMIATIAFFGGLQLMILGIIGMYLGKLFLQSKQRPHYIVKESNIV
jgi:dolichol-phosphate mannosyltransferase